MLKWPVFYHKWHEAQVLGDEKGGLAPPLFSDSHKIRHQKLESANHNLVCLDESGVNIDTIRRYGRAVGKIRVHCSTPLNTPPT